jgi:Mlc titration factor MtfA (ptsG expression regulator)
VVIHEFAHKIDMIDGYTDGTPPLRGAELARWTTVVVDEYERAESRPSDAVLRPYAWSSPAEFFAVATEAFFCTPEPLRNAKPDLYRALGDFYRQDPADP